MNLNQELAHIEKTGRTAIELADEGNFRAARTMLKKIENSFCVSEVARVQALVEAKILQGKGDTAGAKKRILEDMGYLWGIPDGFEILAMSNPKVDADSSLYYVEILGGYVTLGYFTQFSENHIASFEVVANSLNEAVKYIEEVCNFADSSAKQILSSTKSEIPRGRFMHRGVVLSYPFRMLEENC